MRNLGKKGKLKTGIVNTIIMTIILIVVLFQVYAEIIPEAQDAADTMNDSQICEAAGCYYNSSSTLSDNCQVNSTNTTQCTADYEYIPLAGTVGSSGITFIIIMAALLVLVVKAALSGNRK